MQKIKFIKGAMAGFAILAMACNNGNVQQSKTETNMKQQVTSVALPTAHKWVKSPLRNRITLKLNAPLAEVWALVGDPAKMPTYSSGLSKVDTMTDDSGKYTGYTCYFKPMEEGGEEMAHTSKMLWHESMKGWASRDEEPNALGLHESLSLIMLEAKEGKTILSWSMHFNCESEEMLQLNVSSLEQALNREIAQQLIGKFGGEIFESYIHGK